MTPMRWKLLACSTLLISTVALSGCGQSALANRKYYLLDTARQGPPASFHSDATLRVSQFHVDQAFAGRQLVYRVEATRYEPDFYDQFLVPPEIMITEETRDWLANSGLFRQVTSSRSPLPTTYVLEGNATDLYGDFTTQATPRAILEIRFFLVATPEANEVVPLAKTYRAESPISTRTAGAVVDALSKDLADILTRLEADIAKVLIERKEHEGRKSGT